MLLCCPIRLFGYANLSEAIHRGAVWVLKNRWIGHLELVITYDGKALQFIIRPVAHYFRNIGGFVDLTLVATEII